MTYEQIVDDIRNQPALSPGELANHRVFLGGEYAYIAGQLEDILLKKPDSWMELRDKSTSDSQADKKWEATEYGKKETAFRLRLKAIEKLNSAIKTKIDIIQGESRNLY